MICIEIGIQEFFFHGRL